MRNYKSIVNFLLLNLAFMNLALAENKPSECPEPRFIQQMKWLAGDIACNANHCLYKMGGQEDAAYTFGTQYYWHFYIDFNINSLEDMDFAKSKALFIMDNLTYQGGPTKWTGTNDSYTCLYSSNDGATAKAIVTDVRIHP
ncbi:MAG: hypothetical protein V4501_09480 [Pseudomonadota bacterium]